MSRSELSRAALADDLRALGISEGSRLVVHSSLRSLGRVEGGADTVVDCLLEAVGGDGLVAVPTFTYTTCRFEPERTPGRTGAVADALRRRTEARRSLHPFHSVGAIGRGAEALLAGHGDLAGTAVRSPLGRLSASGGLVLLLGVGHVANTTVHVGEFRAEAPYLDIPFDPTWPRSAEIVAGDGSLRAVEYDQFPGCSRAFGALEHDLRRRGAVRDGRVGRASAQLVAGADVVAATVELLGRDPGALLCTDTRCYRCTQARTRLSSAAPGPGAAAGRAR